jgi:hypothetical protein
MGAGPIPWTAINEYAIRHHIQGEDFNELLEMIRKMDNAWLEFNAEQSKNASGN